MLKMRIAIIDPVPFMRDGVAANLWKARRCEQIDTGATRADALHIARSTLPDVMMLSVGDEDAKSNIVAELVRIAPKTALVCLIANQEADCVPVLLGQGAKACISRMSTGSDLAKCLDMIEGGSSYVSPNFVVGFYKQTAAHAVVSQPARRDKKAQLTKREHEILELVAGGSSNREIADRLELSEKTVKRHLTLIMQKIHVRNRVQAALYHFNDTEIVA